MSQKIKSFIQKSLGTKPETKGAIEYITTIGVFGDQVAALDELISGDKDIVDQFAKFCKTFIPFMNSRKDADMKKHLTCWLENYEMYQSNRRVIKAYNKRIEEGDNHTLEEQKEEMQETVDDMKQILQTDGMILWSQTFNKIDYKTIVLDKPYIIGQGTSGRPTPVRDEMLGRKQT